MSDLPHVIIEIVRELEQDRKSVCGDLADMTSEKNRYQRMHYNAIKEIDEGKAAQDKLRKENEALNTHQINQAGEIYKLRKENEALKKQAERKRK